MKLDGPATWVRAPSGLIVPESMARKVWRPTAIDLFSGCGGFSLGLLQAGFEVLAGLDNEPISMMTYTYNLGSYPLDVHFATPADKERLNKEIEEEMRRENKGRPKGAPIKMSVSGSNYNPKYPPVRHFFFGDIRLFDGKTILDALGKKPEEIDLVVGGPPCQGYSIAGKRNIMDARNSLVFEFARMIIEIRPKTFVMENVPGILSMVTPEGIPVLDAFCQMLEDGGFGTQEALKKALMISSGAGAAMKSRTPKNLKAEAEDEEEDQEQLALFKE